MALVMLVLASITYAVGGLFMKQSDGVTRLLPTVAFLALFASGATMQAVGMKQADMGVSYVFVLGLEAVAAVVISAFVLHEGYSRVAPRRDRPCHHRRRVVALRLKSRARTEAPRPTRRVLADLKVRGYRRGSLA